MQAYQKVLWGVGICALAFLSLMGFLIVIGIFPRILIFGMLTTVDQTLRVQLASTAIFAFLFALSLYLPFSLRRRGGGSVIHLKNPLGAVEISQRAICEFIQRVGKEVEGVGDIKAGIKSDEEGVDVFLTLSAQAQGEVPRLIDELQTVIKNYFTHTLGIENVREIKVRVARLL